MTEKRPLTTETSREHLLEQNDELRARLEEAEQTLRAIRSGDVDALVMGSEEKPRIYTLEGPDFPYRSIVETMASGALTLNGDYTILYCNAFFSQMIGVPMEQLIGSSFLDLVPAEHRDTFIGFIDRSHTREILAGAAPQDGLRQRALYPPCGRLRASRPTQRLHRGHRTSRRENGREESLDMKSRTLEEVNIALRVLLKQREGDKSELEENILSNVKELILPYVEKVKKGRLDAAQASAIDIVEANLKEITSPIIRNMQSFDLTPKEIDVVSYLRAGKTTKQIAELLGVSPRAVEFHRYNIRKKLGSGPEEDEPARIPALDPINNTCNCLVVIPYISRMKIVFSLH